MQVKSTVTSFANPTFLEKLDSLNLETIAQKLMHPKSGQGWTSSQVNQAITHYKLFLYLIYLYPNRAIAPTPEIDTIWHQHILDTRKYAQDCQWLFGYFVHHAPDCSLEHNANNPDLSAAFYDTLSLWVEQFGIHLSKSICNLKSACATIPRGQWF
jgi:hypothetical protein